MATVAPAEANRPLLALAESAAAARAEGDLAQAERVCLDVLELSPGNTRCLKLLADLKTASAPRARETLLRRAVTINPDDVETTWELALLLLQARNLAQAEVHARNAVRLAPEDARSHNLMGMIFTETNRAQPGEHHYRRALALLGQRDPMLLANLALNLKNQGRVTAARELYREAIASKPDAFPILLGLARLEEADRNVAAAAEVLDRCEALQPGDANVALLRAVLHGRTRAYDKALDELAASERKSDGQCLGPGELLEKGRLLDRMGRYDDAFEAFIEGKRLMRESSGQAYLAEQAEHLARDLKGFFTEGRLGILPRATAGSGAQPVFVIGFPRSGTTLVEQILSAHSEISAGDELPYINELTAILPRLLASPLRYPMALVELWMGDHRDALDDLRDHYLRKAERQGVIESGARFFTDKMPLNETHLGLIHIIFPHAPIIHLLRHPLDVMLSVVSNQLTHGFYCSYALETAARHYALIFDLVGHYKAVLTLNYLPVRYEDVVASPRTSVEAMLDFVGVQFEEKCLQFEENKRYARTASYAQVTEKLYDRSRYRYRHYRKWLEPIVPILRPAIDQLGYRIDEA